MEWTACPLCSGVQSDLVYTRPDHRHRVDGTLFRVVRCRDCGFVFVNPRPTARSIHRWYPPEFYGAGDVAEAALDRQRERLDAMAAWLSALRPGRLLDVGCYKGEFMLWMARRGWDVRGVEFSATPPNLFGLEIHHGELADAPFGIGDDAPFDAITVWAVLEHVFDPRRVLRECARRLRPGGRLFVLVPNFRSLPARFLQHDDVPRHVLMFTPETLRRLLGECGLRTRRLACEQTIYSGSVRGTLNYAAKLLAGEKHADIVAQNRAPGRWLEFACELRGRRSSFMERIDRLDQRVTPWLDRALDRVGLGFIMTAEAVRE
ncbi:MAG: class I SAM-dependent methyltransferase [Phycisphaerales bacterium]